MRSMLSERHRSRLEGCDDFRSLWKDVFRFRWPRLQKLVAFYLSLDCGSCQLERDLGQLAGLSRTRCGPAQSDASDLERCLEIMLDGPASESELFERKLVSGTSVQLTKGIQIGSSPVPVLLLTDDSRELCALWVELYGRRFHLYKKRSDIGTLRGHQSGSEAAIISGQKRNRDMLVSGAGSDKRLLGTESKKLAVARGKLRKSSVFRDGSERFAKRSAMIKSNHLRVREFTAKGMNHYPLGKTSAGLLPNSNITMTYKLYNKGLIWQCFPVRSREEWASIPAAS